MNSSSQEIDPDLFVSIVQPALREKNPQALLDLLKSRWTKEQVVAVMKSGHEDARKVAALCLSLVGACCCVNDIAQLLKEPDPVVNQLAEHALWSIWFRAGTPDANHQLHRGAQALGRRDVHHAISHFDKALTLCPEFAEAYNQRAIAYFLLDEFEDSLKDCRAALQRMPQHFGAWAGLGHCHAHAGDFARAVEAYERALEINPHMCAIREAVDELREKINS